MTIEECAKVLAKVQLVDNREVTRLVILDWMDYIGDLEFDQAIAAVIRFRRERPGQYLEPGHLRELAGITDEEISTLRDYTSEFIADSKRRALAAAGVTEAEWEQHKTDAAWIRAHFPLELEATDG